MGKEKEEEETSTPKSKSKLSISAMLAIMDQRPEKPKSKPRAKPLSYLKDLDLPPSDSEEDDEMEMPEIEHEPVRRARRAAGIPTNGFAISAKEPKKRERNGVIEAQRLERSRQEALRDRDTPLGWWLAPRPLSWMERLVLVQMSKTLLLTTSLSLPRARSF